MKDGFKKLKTKHLIFAILKSVISGVAAGLAAAGLVMICMKLCIIPLDAWCYAVIGLAAAIAVGVPLFFVFHGSDKKLAKEIDNDYTLQERVQTMVEFAGQSGEIVEMQRQDTTAMLAVLPALKRTYLKFIAPLVALVVSFGIIIPAVVLPADAGTVFDPNYNHYSPSDAQISALNTLISDIDNSAMEEGLKTDISQTLVKFKGRLNDIIVKDVPGALTNTVTTIDGLIYDANSYKTICPKDKGGIGAYQCTALLAREFNNSIVTYKTRNVTITTYSQVTNLHVLVEEKMTTDIEKQVKSLRDTLKIDKNSTEASLAGVLEDIINSLDATAAACEKYAEDDLLKALNAYADGLKVFSGNLSSYTDSYLQNSFDSLSDDLAKQSVSALHTQSFNRMMQDLIRNRIADAFSGVNFTMSELDDSVEVALPTDPNGEGPGGNGPGGDDDDEGGNKHGSGGDQEIDFGSDDKIFNPMTGEYVSYLELLDYYKNLVDNKDVSPELRQFYEDYFISLTQKNNDSQNN